MIQAIHLQRITGAGFDEPFHFPGRTALGKLGSLPSRATPVTDSDNRKVILITGAGGALGSELAFLCAAAGWETVLIDRKLGLLDPVHERIAATTGYDPIIQPVDLVSLGPNDCEELVEAIRAGPGRLDAVIHCAAAFEGLQPMDQIDPRRWLHAFQVNVHAAWLLSVSCISLLSEAPAARLYFVSEDLERVSGAYWGAYGVSKWAVEGMARQFAAELNASGVRVLSIDPGAMRSRLRTKAYHSEDPSLVRSSFAAARKILDLLDEPPDSGSCHVRLDVPSG